MARTQNQTPLARRIDGVNVVDLLSDFEDPGLPFERKLLLCVIVAAVNARAKELFFDPWPFKDTDEHGYKAGLRMGYRVENELEEFVTPPRWRMTPVLRELEAVADLWSLRRRTARLIRRLAYLIDGQHQPPRQGLFRLNVGHGLLDVEVTAWPTRLGHQILLTLPPFSEETVASVEAARLEHFREIAETSQPDNP